MQIDSDEQAWQLIQNWQADNNLSPAQVCSMLGIHKPTYYRALKAGKIAGKRIEFLRVICDNIGVDMEIREHKNDTNIQ